MRTIQVLSLMLLAGSAWATPENARKFKAEGDGLVQRGKSEEAIASYQSAIKEDPEWMAAYEKVRVAGTTTYDILPH